MINLNELQWMTRCIVHANEDKKRAINMAHQAMEMFNQFPDLKQRYSYLYVIASSKQVR